MFKAGMRPAIIMKPQAHRSVRCQCPCDCYSDARANGGCGKPGKPKANYSKSMAAWCGDQPWGIGPGLPCSMHANETAKLLHTYRDIQNSKSPLLTPPLGMGCPGCKSPCGYFNRPPT